MTAVKAAVQEALSPASPRPEHSEWGASGAHRWMVCAGSIALARTVPDTPSSFYAEEGTVAHQIGEQCLLNADRNPADFIGQKLKGQHMEIEVTEEMAEAVDVYVQTIRTDKLLLGGTLMVEHSFDLSALTKHLPGSPPLYGRNDVCLFVEETGQLIVYDYKHGRGHAVGVEENPQLLYYGLGALLERDRARKHRVRSIELVIVQPRASHPDGPVRRWSVDLFDLQEWAADLVAAVQRTLDPNAPLVAGEHCLFCKAYAVCPKQTEKAYEMAALDFKALQPAAPRAPDALTLDELTRVLTWLDQYGEDWFKAVRHYAHVLAQSGVAVPGWKLVQKRPARVYTKPPEEVVKTLTDDFGLAPEEIYTEPELKSVAQNEAVLKRKGLLKSDINKQLWEEHWKKESSGTVLAPDDDPRPALPPPAVADFAGFAQAGAGQASSLIDL